MVLLLGKDVFATRNYIISNELDYNKVRIVYSKYSLYGIKEFEVCLLDDFEYRTDYEELLPELDLRLRLKDLVVIDKDELLQKYKKEGCSDV